MFFKRILSFCLAGMLAMLPLCIHGWEPQEAEVDLRVGIVNDTHILPDKQGTPELASLLSTMGTLGENQLDGFLLVGDVVYYRYAHSDPTDPAPYTTFYEAWEAAGYERSDILAYAMGNHEYPQGNTDPDVAVASKKTFVEQTGFPTHHHTEKNGFHFIAICPDNHDGYATAETQEWVMQEIDKALAESSTNDVDGVFPAGVIPNSKKPVFFMAHYPVDGTVFNAGGDRYSAELEAFLKNRPQVINLTAHWHVPAQLPQTIWQGGFTAIQMPHTAVGNLKEYQATETGALRGISQGMMIEVTDGVVSVYKMDYHTGEFIGTPWIIDVPAIVSDRTDSDSTNDYDHYLYSADKRTKSNAPVYPEGASLSVVPYETAALITYPNNAVMTATGDGTQQDGFTRGYKLEVTTKTGVSVFSSIYQTDFYLPEESRAASFTRTVEELTPGTAYVAKVYPQSPLGTFGEPLTCSFTTSEQERSPLAIRYETEDYCTNENLVKSSEYASGGKIISSNQSGMQEPYYYLNRDTENNPFTITFEADLPETDTYDISYAVGTHKASDFVSNVVISVDGKEIGTNDNTTYTKDLSLNGQYPWKHTPLMLYEKSGIALEKGKHTVTVSVFLPTNTTKEQPFLFCVDFIEFTPSTPAAAIGYTAQIEFETYMDKIPEIRHTDGTIFTPEARSSNGASGMKYLWIDTNAVASTQTATIPIDIAVVDEGAYTLDFICSDPTLISVYADEVSEENKLTIESTEVLDKKNASGLYPIFNTKHYAATKATASVNLTEGNHKLLFVLGYRAAKQDIVQYLDCATLSAVPMREKDGTVTVQAGYKKALTGTAILALYQGNTLVATNSAPMDHAKSVSVSAFCDTAFTHAKLFVWDSFTNCIPLATEKYFEQ